MSRIFTLTSLLIVGLFFHTYAGDESLKEKKRLANLAYDNLNIDSELSLKYARKLELLAEQQKDSVYWSYALNLQGVIYNRYMSYAAALGVLEQANMLKPNNFNILFDLANTHRLANNEQNALYFYYKSLEIDSSKQTLVWSHLGLLNMRKDRSKKAKEYFDKELKLTETAHDTLNAFMDLSFYHLHEKNFEKAVFYLEEIESKIEDFNKDNNSRTLFLIAGLYSNYGQYHIEQGNTEQAEKYFTQALEIADRLRLGLVQEECYRGLQRVSVQKNDEAMFKTYWQKQKDFSVENSRQLAAYYEYLVSKKESNLQEAAGKEKESDSKFNGVVVAFSVIAGILLFVLAFVGIEARKRKNRIKALEKDKRDLEMIKNRLESDLSAHLNLRD